jgi:hypothetical protein
MRILSIHPCGISRVLLHAIKSYHVGPSRFTSLEEGVLRIFITLKNPLPWPGSNPQPLGPVASTLTTAPPSWLCSIGVERCLELFHCCPVICQSVLYVVFHLYEYRQKEKNFWLKHARDWRRYFVKCVQILSVVLVCLNSSLITCKQVTWKHSVDLNFCLCVILHCIWCPCGHLYVCKYPGISSFSGQFLM